MRLDLNGDATIQMNSQDSVTLTFDGIGIRAFLNTTIDGVKVLELRSATAFKIPHELDVDLSLEHVVRLSPASARLPL